MDTRISPNPARIDVTTTNSAPRVTPSNEVPFRDVVARGTGALVRGAQAAVMSLPGAPIVAAAVRPGGTAGGAAIGAVGPQVTGTAESPVAGAVGESTTTGESGSVEQALAQSQQFNMYFLQLQEQLAAENRAYTAMSNVLKARHDTVKNAIGNIR
jgi:hypothetical protein